MIHPTALIDPAAELHDSVEVGAYTIIEGKAVIAEGCKIANAAQLIGKVEVGPGTTVGHGAIIGAEPQDLTFDPSTDSGVRIGSNNTIRELVTIHRSTREGGRTVVGDDNFIMAGVHFGHDVQLGDGNVIANNCLLAGHVHVGDHTFLGGGSVFHQFIRLGDRCLTQGNSAISQDVPPFCVAYRLNRLAGLNAIGLRRAGFSPELRKQLKQAYRALFLSGQPTSDALAEWRSRPDLPAEVGQLLAAVAEPSRKGFCSPKA